MAEDLATRLSDTVRVLADRGLYGMVWLDQSLKAIQRFGPAVDFVPLGVPITESVMAFLGFDEQIQALQHRPSGSVTLPNVLLDPTDRAGPRLTLSVFWLEGQQCYLLLVAREVSRTDLEVILTAQVRARAIAEADVAAKSRLIARANEELSRANQDLQEFAYVISHDLRAPLRALRYFAGDASAAVTTGDLQATAAHLERVQDQAKRMAAMLSGLLEYSRIGRKVDVMERVDTAELIAEIVEAVDRTDAVRIDITGHWPVIETLAQPLDISLRNLVDNALKHHDQNSKTIVVHAADGGDCWIFSVSDDGPGIPKDWHEAIFAPFRRVADSDAGPEGTGIGLALVKKSVEFFGGKIEVASDPRRERGATFHVHWPKDLRRLAP